MSSSNMRHFKQRLVVSAISVGVLFLFIYLSFIPPFKAVFAGMIAVAIGIAEWEYYRIAEAKGYQPTIKLGIITGILFALSTFLATQEPFLLFITFFCLGLTFLFGFIYFFSSDSNPLANMAISVFGVIYIAVPISCAIGINYFFGDHGLQDGRWWLIYALTVTKMTDAGAYFTGKAVGRSPLAKHISPKKTIEGAIGGLITAIIVSLGLPYIANSLSHSTALDLSITESLILGLVLGIFSQIGDLGESLLKRDAGVKDSNELPGLGGMLDVLDSLIFTLPVVYFYLYVQTLY